MGRLLILGFYDRANLGDEMFKETIPLLVPDWVCTFVATDDYVDDGTQWDGIICGGGDIFNDYSSASHRRCHVQFIFWE